MKENAQRELQCCVWQAWTGNSSIQDTSNLQQELQIIMTGQYTANDWHTPLKPALSLALTKATSTTQIRQLLLREVMQHCPQFKKQWIALYHDQHKAMYRRAYWLLRSKTDAEDVVQSLFIGGIAWVLLQEHLLKRELHWNAYLKTCVRRACLESIERKGSEWLVDEISDWSQQNLPSAVATDDWSIYRSLREALEARIKEKCAVAEQAEKTKEASVWSRRQQILAWLLQVPPLLQQEIAKRLKVSEGTISVDSKHIGQILLQILQEGES